MNILDDELTSLYVRLGGTSTPDGRVLRALINLSREQRAVLEWYAACHRPEERLEDNGERAKKVLEPKS